MDWLDITKEAFDMYYKSFIKNKNHVIAQKLINKFIKVSAVKAGYKFKNLSSNNIPQKILIIIFNQFAERMRFLKEDKNYIDNGELLSYLEFTYHQNRQLATKKSFSPEEKLNGISETYHQNGQLASKIDYKDGNVVQVIEKYDFNGNPTN